MTNGVVGKITAGGGTHLISPTALAICETDASTQTKIATIKDSDGNAANITLHHGMTISVLMQHKNNAIMPRLNVNGTGNFYMVRHIGESIADITATYWKTAGIITVTFIDGSVYYEDGKGESFWLISGEHRDENVEKTFATNTKLDEFKTSTENSLSDLNTNLNTFKNTTVPGSYLKCSGGGTFVMEYVNFTTASNTGRASIAKAANYYPISFTVDFQHAIPGSVLVGKYSGTSSGQNQAVHFLVRKADGTPMGDTAIYGWLFGYIN